MRAFVQAFVALSLAMWTMPAWAAPGPCPAGIEVQSSAIASVSDILRIRAANPGKQLNFSGLVLANADFSGRDFSDICFSNSRFPRSNWSFATGNNLQFDRVDLVASRWERFRGQRLKFSYANLENATLAHAVMPLVRFDAAQLVGVDASHADLSGGSVQGRALDSMRQARFDFADLTGFEFNCGIGQGDNCGQDSEKVSLAGANLTNAAIRMAYKSDWDFSKAIINNTRLHFFQLAWIRESRLEGTVIVEPTAWTASRDQYAELLRPVSLSPIELRIVWLAFDRLHQPGFDCEQARSTAERYICSKTPYSDFSRFAEADRELNQAYLHAWRRDRSIVNEQRRWLLERDACMNLETSDFGSPGYECIQTLYRERIEELWQIARMELLLPSGEREFFVDQQTGEFLWQIDDSVLRSKLTSLAFGNSWDLIVIERDPQGRLFASGVSVGSNYHLGNLNSPESGMVFHSKSGFYGGSKPCLPGFEICPIVRFRGHYLDTAPENVTDGDAEKYYFNEFISSGARAGFGRMVRVPDLES